MRVRSSFHPSDLKSFPLVNKFKFTSFSSILFPALRSASAVARAMVFLDFEVLSPSDRADVTAFSSYSKPVRECIVF